MFVLGTSTICVLGPGTIWPQQPGYDALSALPLNGQGLPSSGTSLQPALLSLPSPSPSPNTQIQIQIQMMGCLIRQFLRSTQSSRKSTKRWNMFGHRHNLATRKVNLRSRVQTCCDCNNFAFFGAKNKKKMWKTKLFFLDYDVSPNSPQTKLFQVLWPKWPPPNAMAGQTFD